MKNILYVMVFFFSFSIAAYANQYWRYNKIIKVTTKSGTTYFGILVSDNIKFITIKDIDDIKISINKENIFSITDNTYIIATKSGKYYSGRKISDNFSSITIITEDQTRLVIPKSSIKQISKSVTKWFGEPTFEYQPLDSNEVYENDRYQPLEPEKESDSDE